MAKIRPRLSQRNPSHPACLAAQARAIGQYALRPLVLAALPLASPAGDFASLPGLSPNQRSLGAALDQACPGATGALAVNCAQLQALNPQQQQQAMVQLTPLQFRPQSGLPIKLWPRSLPTANWVRPGMGQSYSMDIDTRTSPGGGSGSGDEGGLRDSPFSFFAQAKAQTGDRNQGRAGFAYDTYGIIVGADYRFTDDLTLGLSTGYTRTDTLMTQDSGFMGTNALLGSFFGSYFLPNEMYIDWIASYGSFNNDLDRRFSYPGLNGLASSQPDVDQYTFSTSLGKDFALGEWSLNPYARFEYMNLQIASYQERGSTGLNYQVAPQSYDSFIAVSGLQASYVFSMPWGVLTPSIRFEWEHQFLNDNEFLRVRLAGAAAGTGNFLLSTGAPDRDYVNLGGAVTAALPGGIGAFLRYESRLGQTFLTSNMVEAGMRIPF
jgi:outer membrane autotransporter protein